MARLPWLLILTSFSAFAQGPADNPANQPAQAPDAPAQAGQNRGPKKAGPPEFENVRKALDALTPEQQKRFQENFLRWSNLSPEEKKILRDREAFRRQKMNEDVESAIRTAGLDLSAERKAEFFKRYSEERKKLEEQLSKETQEKRQPQLRAILEKLKLEFSKPSEPAPAVSSEKPLIPAAQ